MVFEAQFEVGRGKRDNLQPLPPTFPSCVYLNTFGNTSIMCVICGEAEEPYKSFGVCVCVIVISGKRHEYKLLI